MEVYSEVAFPPKIDMISALKSNKSRAGNGMSGKHLALLVFAFVLTVAGAGFGILTFAFLNAPGDHNFFHKIVWIAPIAGAPLFLLALLSRRMLSWAMWLVWLLDCIGIIAINLEDHVHVLLAVLAALSNFTALLTMMSAGLVQDVASAEIRGMRESDPTPQ